MAQRDYTESRQIANDLSMVPPNLIATPELAATGVAPMIAQFYGTARTAARGLFRDSPTKLDIELRDQRNDPNFTRITDAIIRAAQQAENEDRFR